MLTLVASALAGGDCIDDADVLRTGGTAGAIGCVVKAPSTLGTFLRSFRWGHVRQLDQLLARAWAAGAGPGDGADHWTPPSARHTDWPKSPPPRLHRKRGYHPLLAVAAGTGDVLMARLREGRAKPLGAPPTSCVRRWGGCAVPGPGDNSRCGPTAASRPRYRRGLPQGGCPLLHHHPPAPKLAEPHRGHTRGGLDAGPLLDGRRRRETSYTPFQSEPDAAPVRLIVRRVKPTPGSQLALFGYHAFITDRDGDTLDLEADQPRSRTPSGTSSTASVSTIFRPAVSPPTPLGWRYR